MSLSLSLSFPACHFGKLYGLVMSMSAVVSLLQYPCFALVKGPLGGDPFFVSAQESLRSRFTKEPLNCLRGAVTDFTLMDNCSRWTLL